MPNVIQDFPKIEKTNCEATGYYVYGWVCSDWGGVYFYVGKGKNDRYKTTSGRGKAFTAILENWDCFPVILIDNLTEDEALENEDRIKTEFIFQHGYPIMDGEGNCSSLKNRAIREAKQKQRDTNPNYKEGRPKVEVPDFGIFLQNQKKGLITVPKACEQLGISKSTWYRLEKAIS